MIKKILAVVAAVCCLAFPSYADSGVALVTAVKGDVSSGGQAVKVFGKVAAGDKVHVGAGAQVTLMFMSDQHKETINGDTTFAVTASGTNAPANKKVAQAAANGLMVKGGSIANINSDQYGGVAKRSAGGESTITLTGPQISLNQNPELRWTSVEGAANYVVSIQNDPGDAPFVSQTVAGTSVKLNKSLDRGKTYYLKVEAKTADGKDLGEDVGTMEVMSDSQAKALKQAREAFEGAKKKNPDDMSAYISMAARYIDEKLPNEAADIFQQMAARNPSSAYPHERLFALYKSMGMEKEAKEQEARAAELNK